MAVSLKHQFTSAKSDGGDSTLVQPSNWNAEHTLTLANDRVLGRNAGTDGAAQELTGSDLRTLTGLATTDSPQFAGVNLGAGSASGPSIYPTGDANTGVFFPAADTVALSTAGAERMRVSSSGNVGIGTANPTKTLEVVMSDGVTQADITATTYGVNGGGILHGRHARGTEQSPTATLAGDIVAGVGGRAYHSGGAFQASSPVSIHWVASENQTASAYGMYLRLLTTPKGSTTRIERAVLADNGAFVVRGSSGTWDMASDANTAPLGSANNVLILATAAENVAIGAVSYGTGLPGLRFGSARGTPAAPTASQSSDTLGFAGVHGYGATGWSSGTKALITFKAAENWTDAAQGTFITLETTPTGSTTRAERVRIDASGNVGIGATSPGYRLDVQSTGDIACNVASTGTVNTAFLRLVGRSSSVDEEWNIVATGSGLGSAGLRFVRGGWTSTPSMTINAGGELLIGTTTDNGAYLLQVNSQIYATNASIATSDARYKHEVRPLTNALDTIGRLNPVTFRYRQNTEKNFGRDVVQSGFIAQEVQTALAGESYADSVVHECRDHLGVAYEKLIPVLTKALQESVERIAALEARIVVLES